MDDLLASWGNKERGMQYRELQKIPDPDTWWDLPSGWKRDIEVCY
jgi:hypothetical protein